jgi:hypothetical protein
VRSFGRKGSQARLSRSARTPDAQGPEILRRLCGSYAMGPIEVVVALRGEHTLTVTPPGSPPLDLGIFYPKEA